MKRLILFILFLFSIGFIYGQTTTDTKKLIVRDSLKLQSDWFRLTTPANGQYLQRSSGRWVNGNLHVYSDMSFIGTGSSVDPLKLDTAFLMTVFDSSGALSVTSDYETYFLINSNAQGSGTPRLNAGSNIYFTGGASALSINADKIMHTGEVTGDDTLTISDNVVAYSNVSDSLKASATDNDLDWDFAAKGIYIASKAVNDTITFSNLQVNKCLKAKLTISSGAVITWPAIVKILDGSATLGDGTFYVYMDCWASNEVVVSITKEQ